MKKDTFKTIIIILLVLIMVITIILLAYRSIRIFEKSVASQTQQLLLTTTRAVAKDLEDFISEHSATLKAIASIPSFQKALVEKIPSGALEIEYSVLNNWYVVHKKDMDEISLLDSQGIMLYSYPLWKDEKERRKMDYIEKLGLAFIIDKHETYVSEVFINALGNQAISVLEPIFYKGRFVGIIRIMISIDTIFKKFIEQVKVGQEGYPNLIDENGMFIYHQRKDYIGRTDLEILAENKQIFSHYDWSLVTNIIKRRSKGFNGVAIYYDTTRSKRGVIKPEKKIIAYTPIIIIGDKKWAISLVMPYSEILAPIHRHNRNIFGLVGFAFLLFMTGGIGFIITQKKKTELETETRYLKKIAESAEELRQSKEKLANILGSVTDAMMMVDNDFTIYWTNDVAKQWFGSEMEGKKCYAVYHKRKNICDLCIVEKCFQDGKSHEFETEIVTGEGEKKYFWGKANVALRDKEGRPKMVVEFLRDITQRRKAAEDLKKYAAHLEEARSTLEQRVEKRTRELKEANEALIRKERFAVIGQLASSVGHELRNPLGVISNASYFLNMKMKVIKDDAVKKNINIITREINNANKIITDLLDFARLKPSLRQPTDLNQLVSEILSRYLIPQNITIIKNLVKDMPPVSIDPLQVGQVFLNLIENAVQAIGNKEGVIQISTNIKNELSEVSFTDNGCGIPTGNLEKIFEPLFTTKAKGIGLGLAVSKSLAEANGAEILVKSQEGKGSAFMVRFINLRG
ncbi:MAG: ATP-binding protein [bacterium]